MTENVDPNETMIEATMSYIIVNGQKVSSDSLCINAHDRGLTLGHGLFETLLINNGSVPLLEHHWNRLATSVKLLGIKLPFDFIDLSCMINDLIEGNQLTDTMGGVRLTVTDGVSERGLLSSGEQKATFILTTFCLPKTTADSMTATLVETKRNENSAASRIKNISCLDNILAKKEAVAKGFDEAFLLNSKFNLAEGSLSNVFIVKNETVYTPPIVEGALPGVMRHIILHELILNGIEVNEQPINLETLLEADEVFITNALLGVKPIHQLNARLIQAPFKITPLISAALKKQFSTI